VTRGVALDGRSSGAVAYVPYATYATLLLTLVNIFNYMDRMLLAVIVQPIKLDLHLSDTQIGLLSGFAFVAMYAAVSVPLAQLSDRTGRRRMLAAAIAIWSVLTAACGTAHSFTHLVLARLGVGVGEAAYMPSSHALLAEIYPQGRRALPIAIVTAGAAIGIAVGLSVGGIIAARFGWRVAFVVLGIPGLLLAAVVFLTLPEPQRRSVSGRRLPLRSTLHLLFRIRTYRWITLAHPFYQFSTAGVLTWLPAFFMRSHGMTVARAGLFFGITYGMGVAVGCCFGAYLLQTITHRAVGRSLRLAGLLILLAFPFYVAALLISAMWSSLTFMMIFAALMGSAGGPIIAGQQGVVGNTMRAVASAASLFIASYLGGGLGPLLVGIGSERLSPLLGAQALRFSLLVASVAIIGAGWCLILASRRFSADAID
jgi:predicted MFS family arabinose efflux permease